MKKSNYLIALLIFIFSINAFTVSVAEPYTSGIYQYRILEDGTAEITRYTGDAKEITIPEELDGLKVKSIGDEAFSLCANLSSVTIPNYVQHIGNKAFILCKNLTKVEIPNSVMNIGDRAFFDCGKLSSVVIPESVTSIGIYAFYNCDNLLSISIPDGLECVGANPFMGCDKLSDIIISENNSMFEVIEGVLFSKADKRLICYPTTKTETEYTIPHGTMRIGEGAFNSCKSLRNISIPESVTSIGPDAFFNCDNLSSVTIPNSVIDIGDMAFHVLKKGKFTVNNNLTLIVPRDSYAEQYCKNNNLYYAYPDSLDWLSD